MEKFWFWFWRPIAEFLGDIALVVAFFGAAFVALALWSVFAAICKKLRRDTPDRPYPFGNGPFG